VIEPFFSYTETPHISYQDDFCSVSFFVVCVMYHILVRDNNNGIASCLVPYEHFLTSRASQCSVASSSYLDVCTAQAKDKDKSDVRFECYSTNEKQVRRNENSYDANTSTFPNFLIAAIDSAAMHAYNNFFVGWQQLSAIFH
jgi:hypothetical protein